MIWPRAKGRTPACVREEVGTVTKLQPWAGLRSRRPDQANERDQAAEDRDRAADERDRAADDRDRAAEESDWAARALSMGEREQAAHDRELAADDREEAAHDREQAARDRDEAGLDDLTSALRRDRGLADLGREIERARRSNGRLVVAFIDVDRLKEVNDTHGHAAGDQLLRDVAAALKYGLRSYDVVVRYGGDEFVCGLPDTKVETAERRFDEVRRRLAETNSSASVSIGLAAFRSGDTIDELTARADAALYTGARRARSSLRPLGSRVDTARRA